ncbi:predicted protein [Uncinocarpus reesii 1704]|uniref:Asteroid domain-containing protein n=1 Tax=Uncinocarpus reesii (strain UAMH 1704) TaxID=336963 RepID=C4JGQ5_UNCRE|nr:uncharacterized protein UREG_02567 [Uncinocarpus reesii 1704]EEP77718.1 predicted protein [Uncinocarpus reesii 1704]
MSRRKLEAFTALSTQGFKPQSLRRSSLDIETHILFNKTATQTRLGSLPDNPFMVQTVIEDLKTRWTVNAIREIVPHVGDILPCSGPYVWENITEVVPGEADNYCADVAKRSGAAVLTGDSDLLVHDLGPDGSVIFFNSIESNGGSTNEPLRIRATEILPKQVAKKLGVRSIQRFAYELKRDPHLNRGKIVQAAKENVGGVENNAPYIAFLREYAPVEESTTLSKDIQEFDPKVLELYLQFTHLGYGAEDQSPVIYLPMLVENHSRRCAWRDGDELRALAFSVLNLSVSADQRKETVLEYSRRGARLSPIAINLFQEDELRKILSGLCGRLQSVFDNCGGPALLSWKVFALQEIFSERDVDSWPTRGHMRNFLGTGRCNATMSWDDIHLNAQIQSIFYSLRILRQFLEVSVSHHGFDLKGDSALILQLLRELPPLRILSHSISDVLTSGTIPTNSLQKAVGVLFSVKGQRQGPGKQFGMSDNDNGRIGDMQACSTPSAKTANIAKPPKRLKRTNNPYEMLGNID